MFTADGSVRVLGDATVVTYPRSALKPLQATSMVRAGLRVSQEQLALVAASHSGTSAHVAVARSILADAGLTEDALACPSDYPDRLEDVLELGRSGGGPGRVLHNCSGKHSGMVATCAYAGWPVEGYLAPNHPLQKQIRRDVEELGAEAAGGIGVDGCGAPVPLLSLVALARAYQALVLDPADLPTGRVAAAMRARPDLVGGPGRSVTGLMQAVPGLVAKEGAEGVWAAAMPDGRSIAVKLDDGGMRALSPVLATIARSWGAPDEAVDAWLYESILGGGVPVGAARPSPELVDWLS
jgi:L-asparaginase II